MSYVKKHLALLNEAYQLLVTKLDNRYFPTYSQIKRYEGLLGPDTFHGAKLLAGSWAYKKYNHMNADAFNGALTHSENYYYKLVIRLEKRRGCGKEAAWLAHFIVDATEPAHLVDWKVGNNQREKLKKHFKLEKITKDVKACGKLKVTKIRKSLRDFLTDQRGKIIKLNLLELKNQKEIISIYKSIVVPLQIQAIASSWIKALEEANHVKNVIK